LNRTSLSINSVGGQGLGANFSWRNEHLHVSIVDGKTVVSGFARHGSSTDCALARINP
jgi:hypothetical protein